MEGTLNVEISNIEIRNIIKMYKNLQRLNMRPRVEVSNGNAFLII